MPVLLVSLSLILIIVLIFVLFRQDKAYQPSSKRDNSRPQQLIDPASKSLPPLIPKSDAQQQSLLACYPALRDIPCTTMLDRFSPALSQEISPERLISIKATLANIKPLPANYFTLMNLLRNPEGNAREITSVVMTNPVFSAKILQTINSTYFNLPEKIASAGRAITLLGFNSVRSIVLQDALTDGVGKSQYSDAETYTKIWSHSAVVSACSGHLGKTLFQFPENELATIGLLHDIGKYFWGMFASSLEEAKDLPLIMKEEKQGGINHAALGSLIAKNWQLSEVIVTSIEYHHHPSFLPPEVVPPLCRDHVFVIAFADLICNALGYTSPNSELWQIHPGYYELYNLKPVLVDFITLDLTKKLEKAYNTVQSYSNLS